MMILGVRHSSSKSRHFLPPEAPEAPAAAAASFFAAAACCFCRITSASRSLRALAVRPSSRFFFGRILGLLKVLGPCQFSLISAGHRGRWQSRSDLESGECVSFFFVLSRSFFLCDVFCWFLCFLSLSSAIRACSPHLKQDLFH